MRMTMFLLAAWLVLLTTGCTLSKKDQPRSLSEWGKLSRPKF